MGPKSCNKRVRPVHEMQSGSCGGNATGKQGSKMLVQRVASCRVALRKAVYRVVEALHTEQVIERTVASRQCW